MTNNNKLDAFKKLYDLLIFYYENRDQPVEEGFDFFKEVEHYCNELDLNYDDFKKTFRLTNFFE